MKKVLSAFGSSRLLRARDFVSQGVELRHVRAMVEIGFLRQRGRGIYTRVARNSKLHSLALASVAVPSGNICLLSALAFHKLVRSFPREVWVAVGSRAWKPTIRKPRIRVVQMGQFAMERDWDPYVIEGVNVYIFSAVRTVVDCFKFRNLVGIGLAMDALSAFLVRRDLNLDELRQVATAMRVYNTMKPYLEAVLHFARKSTRHAR